MQLIWISSFRRWYRRVADSHRVKLSREAAGPSRNTLQDWSSDFAREIGGNYHSHGVDNLRCRDDDFLDNSFHVRQTAPFGRLNRQSTLFDRRTFASCNWAH